MAHAHVAGGSGWWCGSCLRGGVREDEMDVRAFGVEGAVAHQINLPVAFLFS